MAVPNYCRIQSKSIAISCLPSATNHPNVTDNLDNQRGRQMCIISERPFHIIHWPGLNGFQRSKNA